MATTAEKLATLERYLASARVARMVFHDYWGKHRGDHGRGDPDDVEFFTRMSVWYSLLYVVLEGWSNLGLPNDALDSITDDQRRMLCRFRNKTFHAQATFPHPQLVAYLEWEDCVTFAYWLDEQLRIAITDAIEEESGTGPHSLAPCR